MRRRISSLHRRSRQPRMARFVEWRGSRSARAVRAVDGSWVVDDNVAQPTNCSLEAHREAEHFSSFETSDVFHSLIGIGGFHPRESLMGPGWKRGLRRCICRPLRYRLRRESDRTLTPNPRTNGFHTRDDENQDGHMSRADPSAAWSAGANRDRDVLRQSSSFFQVG